MAKFSEVYDIYAKDVYKYLLALSKDEHLAEELTQETFYKALLNINKFEGKCSLYTWLCQIGRNTYYNQCKKKKSFYIEDGFLNLESKEDFVENIITKEKARIVVKVVNELPEPYKEVFILKTFGELKYREIADVFGKSESWAKVTYFRSKEKIIKQMEGES